MDYHDQPIQFINKFYIRAQSLGSGNYDIIATIWIMLTFLPFTSYIIMGSITPSYVYPKIRSFMQYLNSNTKNYKLLGIGKVLKKAYNPSAILFCLILYFILLAFQIVSFIKLHNYGNEIFHEEKYPQNQEFTFETNRNATI